MKRTTAAILALMMTTAFTASANMVYRETFALDTTLTDGGEDGNGFPFNGWEANVGSGAANLPPSGTPVNGRNAPEAGSPDPSGTGLTNIGASNPENEGGGGPTAPDLGLGRAFYFSSDDDANKKEALFWTEEIAELGTTYNANDLNSISFYIRNSQPDDALRLALNVDGQWYASNTGFTDPDNTWDQETLDFSSGEQWTSFDFTAESMLTQDLGTTGTDVLDNDAGTVDALGVYVEPSPDGGFALPRFDHIEVDAVPEPATTAWMMASAALALALFRRKSKS